MRTQQHPEFPALIQELRRHLNGSNVRPVTASRYLIEVGRKQHHILGDKSTFGGVKIAVVDAEDSIFVRKLR